jgi:lipid-binding SYLF domain-containing protein
MNRLKFFLVIAIALLTFVLPAGPVLAKDEGAIISNASKLVKEIGAIPKRKIPPEVLHEASAIAVFSKAKKNDFMVSGGSARGLLLLREKDGSWSSPVFIRISGGTLGWQIVADPLDIVMIFKDKKHVDALLKGRLDTDAKIRIENGWLGTSLKGSAEKVQKAEVLSYLRSRGRLEEGFTFAGTTLVIDQASNDSFYGNKNTAVADVLSGKLSRDSAELKELQKVLSGYPAVKK